MRFLKFIFFIKQLLLGLLEVPKSHFKFSNYFRSYSSFLMTVFWLLSGFLKLQAIATAFKATINQKAVWNWYLLYKYLIFYEVPGTFSPAPRVYSQYKNSMRHLKGLSHGINKLFYSLRFYINTQRICSVITKVVLDLCKLFRDLCAKWSRIIIWFVIMLPT